MSERRRAEREAQKKNGKGKTSQKHYVDPLLITVGICLFLVEIVWISFGSALGNGFVNFDDNDYVYDNPNVRRGLTLSGIRWVFTHVHASNWHPLTTISHMLDVQLYGMNPWGHHLTNVWLHALAAILLFLALLRLTRRTVAGIGDAGRDQRSRLQENFWPSALVATLFAIHPLRVESVAWISERKDVLSGVFFMLMLWAYANYARSERRRVRNYLLVVIAFALGLMCKPTLVTAPFVLLLLDYWPLERMQGAGSRVKGSTSQRFNISTSLGGLVVEKIPLFVLSAISCVVTMIAQRGALDFIRKAAFPERLGNAVISYVTYLAQTIWPMRLAVLYPYDEHNLNILRVILALLLLILISVVAWIYRKTYPFLLVGWLWFLGTLVPMSGIVQVGWQSRADRYTYLPQIGLFLGVTWWLTALFENSLRYRRLLAVAGLFVILLLISPTRAQTASWKDSVTLWQHAAANTPNNYIAYTNLGEALSAQGRLDQAIEAYEKAIQINGSLPEAEYDLGNVFVQKQKIPEAIAHYQRAIQIKPDYSAAECNLGSALLQNGEPDGAVYHYEKAVELKPDSAELQGHLGSLLARLGRKQEAAIHLTEAMRLKPDYAEAKEQLRELGESSSP